MSVCLPVCSHFLSVTLCSLRSNRGSNNEELFLLIYFCVSKFHQSNFASANFINLILRQQISSGEAHMNETYCQTKKKHHTWVQVPDHLKESPSRRQRGMFQLSVCPSVVIFCPSRFALVPLNLLQPC